MRYFPIAAALAAGVLLAGPVSVSAAEVELKAAYFAGNKKSLVYQAFDRFVDKVNELGKGEIKISRIMGPDAIPPFEMATALKNGIVDIAGLPPSYAGNLVPGIEALSSVNVGYEEQRSSGAYDKIDQIFRERMNAHFLGQYGYGARFHLFLNKKISSVDELKGMRMRTSGTYKAALDAFGADTIQTKRGEIYTALERGLIDGYPQFPANVQPGGWHEVTKYKVNPGFYNPDIAVLVNVDSYNKLSEKQQAILEEAGRALDTEINDWFVQRATEEDEKLKSLGIETIELSEAEGKKLVDLAYEAKWKTVIEKAPDYGPELKKLLYK